MRKREDAPSSDFSPSMMSFFFFCLCKPLPPDHLYGRLFIEKYDDRFWSRHQLSFVSPSADARALRHFCKKVRTTAGFSPLLLVSYVIFISALVNYQIKTDAKRRKKRREFVFQRRRNLGISFSSSIQSRVFQWCDPIIRTFY